MIFGLGLGGAVKFRCAEAGFDCIALAGTFGAARQVTAIKAMIAISLKFFILSELTKHT